MRIYLLCPWLSTSSSFINALRTSTPHPAGAILNGDKLHLTHGYYTSFHACYHPLFFLLLRLQSRSQLSICIGKGLATIPIPSWPSEWWSNRQSTYQPPIQQVPWPILSINVSRLHQAGNMNITKRKVRCNSCGALTTIVEVGIHDSMITIPARGWRWTGSHSSQEQLCTRNFTRQRYRWVLLRKW